MPEDQVNPKPLRITGKGYINFPGGKAIKVYSDCTVSGQLTLSGRDGALEVLGNLTMPETGHYSPSANIYASSKAAPVVKVGGTAQFDNCVFSARCTDEENQKPVIETGGIELTEVVLLSPQSGIYEGGLVKNSDGEVETKSVFFDTDTYYGLTVGGTRVTKNNASNIVGDGIKGGTVSFYSANNTLTLTDAVIDGDNFGIDVEPDNLARTLTDSLTIRLVGSSVINTSNAGIRNNVPITLTAYETSDLTINSSWFGIMADSDLSMSNVRVTVNAFNYGIFTPAINGNGVQPYVNVAPDASLHVQQLSGNAGQDFIAVANVNLNWEDGNGEDVPSDMIIPKNGLVSMVELENGEMPCVIDADEGQPAAEVLIRSHSTYYMEVNGVVVNAKNATDVLGDGKVTYDYDSNTLSLNGVMIKSEDAVAGGSFIKYNGGRPLNISVTGENKVELNREATGSSYWYTGQFGWGVNANSDVLIYGHDSENDIFEISQEYYGHGILADNLEIRDCYVKAHTNTGVRADTLKVTRANLSMRGRQGTYDYPVNSRISDLVLEDCYISSPYYGYVGYGYFERNTASTYTTILDASGKVSGTSYKSSMIRTNPSSHPKNYGVRFYGRELSWGNDYAQIKDADGNIIGSATANVKDDTLYVNIQDVNVDESVNNMHPAIDVYGATMPVVIVLKGQNHMFVKSYYDYYGIKINGANVTIRPYDEESSMTIEGEYMTGIYLMNQSRLSVAGTSYQNGTGVVVAFDGDAPGNTLIVDASLATFLSEKADLGSDLASNQNIDLRIRDAFVNATNATSLTVGGEELITTTTQGKRMVRRKVAGAGDDGDGLLVRGENASYIEILPGHAAPETPYITFADYEVEKVCLAQFDTNGDGVVSMREAALATNTDFLGLFDENATAIETFDELQYFTGLTAIPGELFSGCTSLKSVQIPASVTSIGAFAFQGCDALEQITIPAGVTTIGREALDAKSLKTVYMNAASVPNLNKVFGTEQLSANDFRVLVDYQVHKAYRDNTANWEAVKTKLFPYKSVIDEGNAGDPCDINRDGKVTIADVTKLVNKILGKE